MTSSRTFRDRRHTRRAFTLIELLTVITIIVLLVGLVIGAAGYANTKAARSRAEGEIRALGTIMENYKADNGTYPRSPPTPTANAYTDNLDARANGDPSSSDKAYANATRDLYALLTGQVNVTSGVPDTAPKYPRASSATGPNYWGELKPNMLGGLTSTSTTVTSINDPYGFSYGYSTAYVADAEAHATTANYVPVKGYNPTFDLWSVANKPTSSVKDTPTSPDTTIRPVWIKNW